MEKFRIVIATRDSQAQFDRESPTARSLDLFPFPFIERRVFADNCESLSHLYNRVIEESRDDPAILVFMHDDLHLLDYYWTDKVAAYLKSFDIVGIAGNRRRLPRQPAWCFVDDKFSWDQHPNLSGIVGHGKGFPPENMSVYGSPGVEVKLLDGLFIAVRSSTLHERGLRFDERFAFHFYDLDFCREAEARGLKMGTCPVSLVHQSGGDGYGSPAWWSGYQAYLAKWQS